MTNNEDESFPGVWVRKKKKSKDMSRNTSSSSIDSLYSESSEGPNNHYHHHHHQYPQNWHPYQTMHHQHHHHHYFPPSTPTYPQDPTYIYNQSCNQCIPPQHYPTHLHGQPVPLQPKPMSPPFVQDHLFSPPNRRQKPEFQNKREPSPKPNSQIAIPGTDIPSLTNFTNILLAYMNNTTTSQPHQNQLQEKINTPKINTNNINNINNNTNIPENNENETNRNNDTTEEANGDDSDKVAVDPRKYKTRMCRNWENTGHCPYEHTCCFAHGPDELRDLSSNHKLLASIGYFSNVILLAMTNGQKPALPPHTLYQQPALFKTPHTAEELHACTKTVPTDVRFPYQEPLGAAFRALKKEQKDQRERRKQLATDRSKNKR